MTTNVEVTKGPNENAASLIRRFTKRIQGSGVLKRVRSMKNEGRPLSKYTRRKRALKHIARMREIERLKKLGKIN